MSENQNTVTENTNPDDRVTAERTEEAVNMNHMAESENVNAAAQTTAPSGAENKAAQAQAQGEAEYHDVFWYAVQALKANATQSTWKPAVIPDQCDNKELAACEGGCGSCGFKCGRALFDQQPKRTGDGEIPGDDPFAERNPVHMSEPPLPETTFPLPQVLISVAACIAGCFLAERIIHLLFG